MGLYLYSPDTVSDLRYFYQSPDVCLYISLMPSYLFGFSTKISFALLLTFVDTRIGGDRNGVELLDSI
jgi:uncharacterized protein YlaN (UPF0358 family)